MTRLTWSFYTPFNSLHVALFIQGSGSNWRHYLQVYTLSSHHALCLHKSYLQAFRDKMNPSVGRYNAYNRLPFMEQSCPHLLIDGRKKRAEICPYSSLSLYRGQQKEEGQKSPDWGSKYNENEDKYEFEPPDDEDSRTDLSGRTIGSL